jgi:hypothetical protein
MAGGSFGGGDGSSGNPFLVEDAADLDAIRATGVTLYYRQVADIDMTGISWVTIPGTWTGQYNGDMYIISNLTGSGGLFANGTAASIPRFTNIRLSNVNIDGGASTVGAIANQVTPGYVSGGSLGVAYRCSVMSGTIVGTGIVGGVIGRAYTTSATSSNYPCTFCSNYASVTGGNYVGGIVGQMYAAYTGGAYMRLYDCHNGGVITGNSGVGGIVGQGTMNGSLSTGGRITIAKCLSTGNVFGVSNVGGILGGANVVSSSNAYCSIEYCVSLMESINRTAGTASSFGRIRGIVSNPSGVTLGLNGNRALETIEFLSA